jgi:hypothetical protein
MRQPLVQIVDGAVPRALFLRARRKLQQVGSAATYWKTFWFPWGEPTNVVEELALALRVHLPAPADAIIGAEWWIGRMRATNVPLDFHHDRDLELFEQTGRLRHPRWSSVLFFNRVRGGSLFITDQRLVRRGQGYRLSPGEPEQFATARPDANRFALFPGDRLHGVLDANDEVPHGRLRGPPGRVRLSLVFNWWEAAPRGVRPWAESRSYRALRSANGKARPSSLP